MDGEHHFWGDFLSDDTVANIDSRMDPAEHIDQPNLNRRSYTREHNGSRKQIAKGHQVIDKKAKKKKVCYRPRDSIPMSLISGFAFLNAPNHSAYLQEIYAFAAEHFQNFDPRSEVWKKTIRHSLCNNRDMYAQINKENEDAHYMLINKDLHRKNVQKYMNGITDIDRIGLKNTNNWHALCQGYLGLPYIKPKPVNLGKSNRGIRGRAAAPEFQEGEDFELEQHDINQQLQEEADRQYSAYCQYMAQLEYTPQEQFKFYDMQNAPYDQDEDVPFDQNGNYAQIVPFVQDIHGQQVFYSPTFPHNPNVHCFPNAPNYVDPRVLYALPSQHQEGNSAPDISAQYSHQNQQFYFPQIQQLYPPQNQGVYESQETP